MTAAVTAPTDRADGRDGAGLPAGFSVTGGAGGTVARLEDLTWAAARLDATREALEDAVRRVSDLLDGVEDAALWSPHTAPTARRALREASPRAVAGAADRSGDLAADLRAAVAAYHGADEAVRALLGGLVERAAVVAGRALGEAGPLAWVATAAAVGSAALWGVQALAVARLTARTPTPAGLVLAGAGSWLAARPGAPGVAGALLTGPGVLPSAQRLRRLTAGGADLRAVEPLVPGLAAFLAAAAPGRALPTGDPVRQAAGVGVAAGDLAGIALSRTPTVLAVAPVVGPPRSTPEEVPRTVGDVVERIEDQYPAAGGLPGTVAVTQLEQPDGTLRWLVVAPGTESGSLLPDGANPLDVRSDLELPAGRDSDAVRLAVQAMTQAGIAPDEPVTIAGHSLGGMVAAEIAADPLLRGRFDVEMLITAGAPVADVDVPPEVAMLSLEHAQDPVPLLDGERSPDTRSRTTVVRDLAAGRGAVLAGPLDISTAHGAATYAETARLLEDSDDRSVRDVTKRLAVALGSPDATATTTVYQGARLPTPPGG